MGDAGGADMMLGALNCPFGTGHMGVTAENVAIEHQITREDQDAFAMQSQTRAGTAISEGRFRDQIVPVEVRVKRDTVPFDTDLEKVRKIFKKIGQQIAENPEYADDLLAPFKSQGAADVTDVGIVVRGKFTTRPGGQWMIRKEIYNRVQKAFEENGISFARREVFVRVSDDDDEELTPDQKRAAGAAAAQAAEPAA